MTARRFDHAAQDQSGLSAQFDRRLRERLAVADSRRQRRAIMLRWRWTALVLFPLACAICWAALPFTFGDGVRALAGALGYLTMLLAVAQDISRDYLSYLGLGSAPFFVDVSLLVGVVSWLIWASHSEQRSAFDGGANTP